MNMPNSEEIRGLYRYLENANDMIFNRLKSIDSHLNRLNGKIVNHEERMQNIEIQAVKHPIECPIVNKVDVIERKIGEKKAVKRFIMGSILVAGMVLGILLSTLQINSELNELKNQIKKQNEEISTEFIK